MSKSDFKLVPIEDITTPKNGAVVIMNHYWVTDDEGKHVLKWKGISWQRNSDERVIQSILRGSYPFSKYVLIEVAYVKDES